MARTARDEGAASTEYALLAAAVAAVILLILLALGRQVYQLFDSTCRGVATQTSAPDDC